jgi:hypothetical protein
MLTKSIVLTLVAGFGLTAAASAQKQPVAVPTVEPAIAFAGDAAVALRNDGDVITWGSNADCVLGRATTDKLAPDQSPAVVMHNAKAIATYDRTIAVLTTDGRVYSWGLTTLPMGAGYVACDGPAPVPSLEGKVVTHIGLGSGLAVAVTDSGDLYCAGNLLGCPANSARNPDSSFKVGNAPVATFTRLSLPELNGNVLDIRVGGSHTLVLTKDRKLYAFGESRWGQLGDSRFKQGGASSGVTPDPVLTNVVSFAAGGSHSVAVKDDGTVWTWGRNGEDFALCDGTTVDRRVPSQLHALTGRVVQVAAHHSSTLLRTAEGVLYACGRDVYGQLGLRPGRESATLTPIQRPTQIPAPAARSALVVMAEAFSAFSPDGCNVYIAGIGKNVRGATEPSSPRMSLRSGLSLCAPQSTTPVPDVAAGALHRVPAAPAGVDCWIPKFERDSKDPKLEPIRKALLTVERLVKESQAFMTGMPERVRMEISTSIGNGNMRLEAAAYPRQLKDRSEPYWTSAGCDIVRTARPYEQPLGLIQVNVNRSGFWEASHFNQQHLKPVRIVAGFPVFQFRTPYLVSELLIITKDGRLPIVPVTLADRLDREADFLAMRLDEVRKQLAAKLPAATEVLLRPQEAELRRQIAALGVYRASFSADELHAAWVQHDPQGREGQELEARVKAMEALSPEDQAQVNALGARVRTLQLQARARGVAPEEATRLRSDANEVLQQAQAIELAQKKRVAAQVPAARDDFAMKLMRPGAAADATEFKDDPTFWDTSDPNRIQLITVDFQNLWSQETSPAQAQAWMDKVEATFDYQALKALIR